MQKTMISKILAWTSLCLLSVVFLPNRIWALHPLHESTYLAFPQGLTGGKGAMHLALIVPRGGDALYIPVGGALALGSSVEVGAGLKTVLGDASDIQYLTFGGQFAGLGHSVYGLHLLLDANGGDNHGLTATYFHQGGLSRRIATALGLRLGFMEALVAENALMAMEAGYALRLALSHGVALQAGLVAASQTKHFNDYFSLDFEPEVRVGTGRQSAVATILTLGLAGERREDFRVKVAWTQRF